MAPKKKGKGKGDKLARMSVEQRQQYLDRRAAQEAESNRRREELVAGFLKLKLSDEHRKGSVNESKLMTKWREILRTAKTANLTTQLKDLKARVSEATTRQDRLIGLLASQVEQAQHQRTLAAHNHLTAVHKLTALHEEHVAMLTQYVRQREASVCTAMAMDTEQMAARHLTDLRNLELVANATQHHHDLTEKEELAAFHTTITHITTQLEEELAAARVERETSLEEAWSRLATAVKDHEDQTATLRATCKQLQDRVTTNRKNLTSVNQAIKDIQEEVEEVRERLQLEEPQSEAAQSLDHLKGTLEVLRGSLGSQRVRSRTIIKAINNRGYSAKKRLEEVLKEGKSVLELASACSRLETPRDRNVPFMPPPPQTTIAASATADGSVRTRLVATAPAESEHLGRPQQQELETQVGITSDADDGLGTSIQSSKTPSAQAKLPHLRKISRVMEVDEGVGSSVGYPATSTLITPSTSTIPVALSLPKIPSPHPSKGRTVIGVRGGPALAQDKLARISELLYHEEAAQEVAHLAYHPDQLLDPPPDFVLQEADAVLKTHDDLRNFWRKYHHVQLERLALHSEADALRQEGRHLRACLKQYLISLGVSDAALVQPVAPVTVSHPPIIFHQNHQRQPRKRSQSVPSWSVMRRDGSVTRGEGSASRSEGSIMRGEGGHTISTHSSASFKWPSSPPPKRTVQEANLLVRATAMHSGPARVRTC